MLKIKNSDGKVSLWVIGANFSTNKNIPNKDFTGENIYEFISNGMKADIGDKIEIFSPNRILDNCAYDTYQEQSKPYFNFRYTNEEEILLSIPSS